MANTRSMLKRLAAVRNVRTITAAMETIASSRFKKAHNLAVAARPYTSQLSEMVADISMRAEERGKKAPHPLLAAPGQTRDQVLLTLTASRGLCGGYNDQVLRVAMERRGQLIEAGYDLKLQVVGSKGIQFLRFRRVEMDKQFTDVPAVPEYAEIAELADAYMDQFLEGSICGLEVAYMQYVSASRQTPAVAQILPLTTLPREERDRGEIVPYEFVPSPVDILERLLPAAVRLRLYQCMIDAVVGEQIARIKAMRAGTENADEMIRTLTVRYNRLRQSRITTELAEILGGRAGLDKG